MRSILRCLSPVLGVALLIVGLAIGVLLVLPASSSWNAWPRALIAVAETLRSSFTLTIWAAAVVWSAVAVLLFEPAARLLGVPRSPKGYWGFFLLVAAAVSPLLGLWPSSRLGLVRNLLALGIPLWGAQ